MKVFPLTKWQGQAIIRFDQMDVHSKNSRARFDPEKGPMGPDPFLGQTDLESG